MSRGRCHPGRARVPALAIPVAADWQARPNSLSDDSKADTALCPAVIGYRHVQLEQLAAKNAGGTGSKKAAEVTGSVVWTALVDEQHGGAPTLLFGPGDTIQATPVTDKCETCCLPVRRLKRRAIGSSSY